MERLIATSGKRGRKWTHALLLAMLLLVAFPASRALSRPALVRFPDRPPAGTYIVDVANIISVADETAINREIASLYAEQQIPIIVVTINSLAVQQASDYSIERYAGALFDTYGIGTPERNLGILLLVSRGDRQARIELGAGWGRSKNEDARRIMDRRIIPQFKRDNYSQGIRAGVQSLSDMARGEPLPVVEVSPLQMVLGGVLLLIGIAFAISLFRSGRAGWGFAVLAFIGMVLAGLARSYAESDDDDRSFFGRDSSRNSSFDSDSFGGGFSGGGGASGSW